MPGQIRRQVRRQLAIASAVVAVAGVAAPGVARASTSDVEVTVNPTVTLPGSGYDFEYGTRVNIEGSESFVPGPVCSDAVNPDFEANDIAGAEGGLVAPTLDGDGLPVWNPDKTSSTSTHGKTTFDQWYHSVPGVNLKYDAGMTFTRTADDSAPFGYRFTSTNENFFPADHKGWDNPDLCGDHTPQEDVGPDDRSHNFSFTYHLHTTFLYGGGETISLSGDDDYWLFLDDRLFVDEGGLHPETPSGVRSVDDFGLTPGHTYSFDLFSAERHTDHSVLSVDTTLALQPSLDVRNLSVAATSIDGPVGPGASDVAISDIPSSSLPPTAVDDVAAAPMRSVPMRSVPMRSVPMRSVPMRSVSLASVPLSNVLLSQIPLSGTTWADQLAGTRLASAPLESVTLLDAFDALAAAGKPGPTMDQVDLSQTPLRNMTVASVYLGDAPLSSLDIQDPPPGSSSDGTNFGNWCAWFEAAGASCTGLTGSSPVLAADLSGIPMRSVPMRSVPMRSVPADAPMRSVPMRSVDLLGSPLADIPLSDIRLATATGNTVFGALPLSGFAGTSAGIRRIALQDSLAGTVFTSPCTCANLGDALTAGQVPASATLSDLQFATGFGNFTLGDLVGSPGLGDITIGQLVDNYTGPDDLLTVGDVLLALVPGAAVNWEATPLQPLQLSQYDHSAPVVTYTVSMDLTGTPLTANGTVHVTLPPDFRYAGIAAGIDTESGEGAQLVGGDVVFTLKNRPVNQAVTFRFKANPGLTLGQPNHIPAVSATFAGEGLSASAGPVEENDDVTVGDVAEFGVGNNDPSTAPVIAPDHLIVSHISAPGDTDFFRLPVPATGTHVHVLLSHLATDDDLVVYGPQGSDNPPGSTPMRSVPMRSVPLLDEGVDAGTGAAAPTPQLLNDVPLRADLPLRGTSVQHGTADEEVDTLSSGGSGYYTIQVTGYNGAWSASPYLLRVVEDSPTPVSCDTPARPMQSVSGTAPSGTTDTKSLFLVNVQQMTSVYGSTDTNALLDKLNTFAARADVAGLVVPVDSDAGVVSAYNDWNGHPCNVADANAVVDAVDAVVRGYKNGSAPHLTSVVLVGSDQQLPMRRIPDLTLSANENGYAETDAGSGGDNPLSAAQKESNLLSDDSYGSLQPVSWLDRRLYLPDLAVGRLVESPAEIAGQIDQFVTAGGALTPSTAFTTGYDFLADGARGVDAALGHDVTGTHSTLIDDPGATSPWTRSQLLARLFPSGGQSPVFDSINAHFDHNRSLPSAGNATGSESDLFTVDDITANPGRIPGRVLFSMGCHAGLNVPDGYIGTATSVGHDWAQTFAQQKAIWVANTGYGLGDTASVALSEELMRQFAQRLDGSMSAGQALQFAKQAYFGLLGAYGVYDEKALEEPVFYGLPMWRVGGARWDPPAAGSPAAPVPGPVTPVGALTNPPAAHATTSDTTDAFSTLAATDVTITPTFTKQTTPRGSFWDIGGETQVTHYRPIQPRTSVGVSPPAGTQAHGALITALSSEDHTGIDPVVARPTLDLSTNEPEASSRDTAFPTQFQTLTTFTTPSGPATRLVMLPGQFFSGRRSTDGTQRLFTTMSSRVLYSSSSNFTAPTLTNARSTLTGGTATFSVDATGHGSGVVRAIVLFHTAGASDWQRLELTHGTGDTWSGSTSLASESVEWFAQVADAAGNTATTDDKGALFGAQTGFKASIVGTTGLHGWYTSTVAIDADGPASYRLVDGGVDQGPLPQTLGSGDHQDVQIVGSDHSTHVIGDIKVDLSPPTATVAPLNFKLGGSGTYTVTCTDDLTAVVADCPAGGTVSTAAVGTGVITFDIHDDAGNAQHVTAVYTVGANFAGFLQPVNDPWTVAPSVFKYNSTIPLKFQLKNQSGGLMSDSAAQAIAAACGAKLSFAQVGTTSLPADESEFSDPADSGGCFRYDSGAHQFIYNLGTKTLPGGSGGQNWALRAQVTVGGGVIASHAVVVGLK